MPTLNDHSETVTEGIRVRVLPRYLPEHSDPEANRFVFGYRITIENEGDETVQLLTRHWIITDSTGKVTEVKGEGVVGKQPVLEPGESFEYMSGSRMESPMGTMHGTYQMVGHDGEPFDIEIPAFTLAVPGAIN